MPAALPPRPWDVFCRVVDNHGDLGVCWRLARALAEAGRPVRLFVDDPSALTWMAPDQPLSARAPASLSAGSLCVLPWSTVGAALEAASPVVLVETFGAAPPADYLSALPRPPQPDTPVWVNLEYLSAEAYVERSHGLPSPQHHGPAAGLTRWFYYPGFTPVTGGLLRRPHPVAQVSAAPPGRRRVSLFSYASAPVAHCLDAWQHLPLDLVVFPGPGRNAVQAWHPSSGQPADGLRIEPHDFQPQPVHDALLADCDLNLVRGEDSFVTALWVGRPLLWQIYPQHDQAHHAKLEAFLDPYLADAPPDVADASRRLHQLWNGLPGAAADPTRAARDLAILLGPAAAEHALAYARTLGEPPDLLERLTTFVELRQRSARCPGNGTG